MLNITELPWDSEFFGCKIGKLNPDEGTFTIDELEDALRTARTMEFKCLYFETDFNRPQINAFCSASGFLLVDIKTKLFKKLSKTEIPVIHPAITSSISAELMPALEIIADEISSKSRFAHDPLFGPEKSRELFNKWLRKSVLECYCESFFCYVNDSGPAGFITIKKNRDEEMVIDLLGVNEKEKKKGISAILLQAAENYAINRGEQKLSVTTQGYNIAALRFYQKHLFAIERADLFYHIWLT